MKSGVKLHLRLADLVAGDVYHDKLTITTAKVHDVNQLEILIDKKLAPTSLTVAIWISSCSTNYRVTVSSSLPILNGTRKSGY